MQPRPSTAGSQRRTRRGWRRRLGRHARRQLGPDSGACQQLGRPFRQPHRSQKKSMMARPQALDAMRWLRDGSGAITRWPAGSTSKTSASPKPSTAAGLPWSKTAPGRSWAILENAPLPRRRHGVFRRPRGPGNRRHHGRLRHLQRHPLSRSRVGIYEVPDQLALRPRHVALSPAAARPVEPGRRLDRRRARAVSPKRPGIWTWRPLPTGH